MSAGQLRDLLPLLLLGLIRDHTWLSARLFALVILQFAPAQNPHLVLPLLPCTLPSYQ
jgi:hypothetical protein